MEIIYLYLVVSYVYAIGYFLTRNKLGKDSDTETLLSIIIAPISIIIIIAVKAGFKDN